MANVDWRFATAWTKTVPYKEVRGGAHDRLGRTYKHASVRDERIVSAAKLGKRLEQPGAELVAKTECVEGGWGAFFGPPGPPDLSELGDIPLSRRPALCISM